MTRRVSLVEHPSSTPIFSCVRVASISVFYLLSCLPLFVLSSLAILLSVLPFTVSWYRQSFLRNISSIMFIILCNKKKPKLALIKAECPYI